RPFANRRFAIGIGPHQLLSLVCLLGLERLHDLLPIFSFTRQNRRIILILLIQRDREEYRRRIHNGKGAVKKIELVKRADQVDGHAAKDKKIDYRKEEPERIGRLAPDELTPLHEIDTRNQTFDGAHTCLWKEKV